MSNKIFKTGHSAVVALSPKVLKDLELKVGDSLKVETDKELGTIIIRKAKRQDQLPLGLKIRPKLSTKY